MTSATIPGWEGAIGPFPGQYAEPHVYARDVHSGAGNCVCGAGLSDTKHIQAAPGVPLPTTSKRPKVHDYSALEAYTPPALKPRAVIVDLDGTMCLHNGRSPYDYSLVHTDLPNAPVIRAVAAIAASRYEVVFLSGRPDSCRDATEQWLVRYYSRPYVGLFMRTTGDNRTDWIVKEELFTRHIRHEYQVLAAFDDRNQVVGMWRAIGLTVFQVAEGNF